MRITSWPRAWVPSARMCLIPRGFVGLTLARKRFTLGRGGAKLVVGRDGRIYRRGDIYYVAYRWDGREYRESARSAERGVAEHLLATRLRERRGSSPPAKLTFDALAAWYLDDYLVRRLRTLDTARGRVANLRAVFGGWPATAITTEAIRDYQRRPPPGGCGRGDGQPGDVGAESDVPPRGAQSTAG